MTMSNQGISKLVEECGELQIEIGQLVQILGKKLARMDSDEHWDPAIGSLSEAIAKEMGDVIGAMAFVSRKLKLDQGAIADRGHQKLAVFLQWEADPNN